MATSRLANKVRSKRKQNKKAATIIQETEIQNKTAEEVKKPIEPEELPNYEEGSVQHYEELTLKNSSEEPTSQ